MSLYFLRNRSLAFTFAIVTVSSLLVPAVASAQEPGYSLTIRDNKFEPGTLNVKAGIKFRLTVTNAGSKAAEFESVELNREKVIPPGGSAVINIGPLKPGTYSFFDEFNESNRGQIIAE